MFLSANWKISILYKCYDDSMDCARDVGSRNIIVDILTE